MIDLDSNNYFW